MLHPADNMGKGSKKMKTTIFGKSSFVATAVVLLLSALAQPAAADILRSWSYVMTEPGVYLMDDHFRGEDPAFWQGSSAVQYDARNYAKSSIAYDSSGLDAKIAVAAGWPISGQVYSRSYYRDFGFQCDATVCGTAVPLGASFTTRISQDGRLTPATANFSVGYNLKTASMAYSFGFSVWNEGSWTIEGSFSTENLVSGAMQTTPLRSVVNGQWVFNPFFNMVWTPRGSGVYDFSYDFSFTGATHGVDLAEELSIEAYLYGARGGFADSYNSFHADMTPQAGVVFYSDSGRRVVGSAAPTQDVPEPGSLLLLGAGLVALARRRKA